MGFSGKNTGVGCHFLFQGVFLTQESNWCLLHWQADSLPPGSHKESDTHAFCSVLTEVMFLFVFPPPTCSRRAAVLFTAVSLPPRVVPGHSELSVSVCSDEWLKHTCWMNEKTNQKGKSWKLDPKEDLQATQAGLLGLGLAPVYWPSAHWSFQYTMGQLWKGPKGRSGKNWEDIKETMMWGFWEYSSDIGNSNIYCCFAFTPLLRYNSYTV